MSFYGESLMAYTKLIESFRALKLHAMADTFIELSQTAGFSKLTKESLLNELNRSELSDRKIRSINYQLSSAKFPVHRDLNGFQFSESPVNEEQVRALHEGSVIPSFLVAKKISPEAFLLQ